MRSAVQLDLVHAANDVPPIRPKLLTGLPGDGKRAASRREASAMVSDALASYGMTLDSAAKSLHVSRPAVSFKSDPGRAEQWSLADMLALVDGGGAGLEVADAVARALAQRCDERRGRVPPSPGMVGKIALWCVAIVGEVCSAAGMGAGTAEQRAKILELCAAPHAQVGQLEACVRAMR